MLLLICIILLISRNMKVTGSVKGHFFHFLLINILTQNYLLCLQARLGGEDIGYSFRRDLKLIGEVQAPFRGVRRFFSVALSAAAGISLFFTVPRLLRAIEGGDDAPDLIETAENLAINIGGKPRHSAWPFIYFASGLFPLWWVRLQWYIRTL